jgi:glycosyltransferase involved in cell wall biosynthesis
MNPTLDQGGTSTFSQSIQTYLLSHPGLSSDIKLIFNVNHKKHLKPDYEGEIEFLNLHYRHHLILVLFKFTWLRLKYLLHPFYKPSLLDIYSILISERLSKTNCDFFWFVTPPPFMINLPFISPIYNLSHLEFPWIKDFNKDLGWENRDLYFSKLIGKAYKVIFVNSHHSRIAIDYYGLPLDKIVELPFPVSDDIYRFVSDKSTSDYDTKLNDFGNFFIYPANYWVHKNHEFLIQIFSEIKQANNGIKLLLTGSDPEKRRESLLALINSLDLKENVLLLDFIKRENLLSLISSSKGVLFPSFLVHDSIPETEAASIGVPFIKGNFGEVKNENLDGTISIPFSKKELWVEEILRLAVKPSKRSPTFQENMLAPSDYVNKIILIFNEFKSQFI